MSLHDTDGNIPTIESFTECGTDVLRGSLEAHVNVTSHGRPPHKSFRISPRA